METPVKPSEAAARAGRRLQEREARTLSDETRSRIATRLSGLGLAGIRPHIGSLARDPRHASTYYLAADALDAVATVLLRLSAGSPPSDEMFRDAVQIGRVRPGGGREVVVDAIPFGSADGDNIRTFIERIDSAFQPRPRGAQAAIVAAAARPDLAFAAWRTIFERTGWNAAGLAYAGGTTMAEFWSAAVSAAIRAGWRGGYSIEADQLILGEDGLTESVQHTIGDAALFSKFRIDTSRLLDYRADHRTRHGWSEPDVQRLYEDSLAPEVRSWIEAEYKASLAPHEVRRLAVKFGRSLLCIERVCDEIAQRKSRHPAWARAFDFEPSFESAQTITRAKELRFCLHWLKTRGRAPQSFVPNLAFRPGQRYPEDTVQQLEYIRSESWDEIAEATGVMFPGKPLDELAHRVSELAAVAREFGVTLTLDRLEGKQPAVIQLLGRSTGGRLNLVLRPEENAEIREIVSAAENLRS
jgi:hypothetical protein